MGIDALLVLDTSVSPDGKGRAASSRVAGLPVIVRIIASAQRAGVERFAVVASGSAGALRLLVEGSPASSADIVWHEVAGDAGSAEELLPEPVLKHLGERYAVVTADQVLDPESAGALRQNVPDGQGCITPASVDEASAPVAHSAASLKAVLADSDAPTSLAGIVERLSGMAAPAPVDTGRGVWHMADTRENRKRTVRLMGRSLRKPKDGPIARLLNRSISIPISLALAKTPITPNQISILNLLLGLASAYLFSVNSYVALAWAGVILQIASILDGCDGEIARLKFSGSLRGQFVDTVADHASFVAVIVGLTWGQYVRSGGVAIVLALGGAALLSFVLAAILLYRFLRSIGSGTGVDFKIPGPGQVTGFNGMVFAVYRTLFLLVRQDVFRFGCMLIALADLPLVLFSVWIAGPILYCVALVHVLATGLAHRSVGRSVGATAPGRS